LAPAPLEPNKVTVASLGQSVERAYDSGADLPIESLRIL